MGADAVFAGVQSVHPACCACCVLAQTVTSADVERGVVAAVWEQLRHWLSQGSDAVQHAVE